MREIRARVEKGEIRVDDESLRKILIVVTTQASDFSTERYRRGIEYGEAKARLEMAEGSDPADKQNE